MYLKLVLILLVLTLPFSVLKSQIEQSTRSDDCYEVIRKEKDYFIEVNGEKYNDGGKIFICPNDIPAQLRILYNSPADPRHLDTISAINWSWQSCNCEFPTISSPENSIGTNNLNNSNDKVKFTVKFRENYLLENLGKSITLKATFHLINNFSLDSKKNYSSRNYSYDTHDFNSYPFHNSRFDSKYLATGLPDDLYFKGHKNLHKSLTFEDIAPNNLIFNASDSKVEMVHNGVQGVDSLYVKVCGMDTIVDVDIHPEWTIPIKLYSLCESNDDYANYCVDKDGDGIPYENGDVDGTLVSNCQWPISGLLSPDNFNCINVGADGTLDLYRDLSTGKYWNNRKDNDPNKPSDVLNILPEQLHLFRIHPSLDPVSGLYHCNSRPYTLPMDWNTDIDNDGVLDTRLDECPNLTQQDIATYSTDLNTIYNKIGIEIIVDYQGQVGKNFNSISNEDNNNTEQLAFHISQFGTSFSEVSRLDTTVVWVVDKLDNSRGRATLGDIEEENSNSLMLNKSLSVSRTLAHELGHARFNLFHPDGSTNNPNSPDNGWQYDNLAAKVSGDFYNLMNSGFLYNNNTTHDITAHRIRKYQWRKIWSNL